MPSVAQQAQDRSKGYHLTERFIRSLKNPEKRTYFRDKALRGFNLKVEPSGKKVWIVRKRPPGGGNASDVPCGEWPATSYEEARQKAEENLRLIAKGHNPNKRERSDSFGPLVEKWLTSPGKRGNMRREKTIREYRRILLGYAEAPKDGETREPAGDFAKWYLKPVGEITQENVDAALDSIVARSTKYEAVRRASKKDGKGPSKEIKRGSYQADYARRALRAFFQWCKRRKKIDVNPAADVDRRAPATRRRRPLINPKKDDIDFVELVAAWRAIDRWEAEAKAKSQQATDPNGVRVLHFYPWPYIYRLAFLTGQRREVIQGLRWDEIADLKTEQPLLEIPDQRSKNRESIEVPLSSMAAAVLRSIPRTSSEFVFPAARGDGHITHQSKEDARIRELAKAEAVDMGRKDAFKQSWRFHDTRSTLRTWLAVKGCPDSVARSLLGQKAYPEGTVDSSYVKGVPIPLMREWAERWASEIQRRTAPAGGARVIKLRA